MNDISNSILRSIAQTEENIINSKNFFLAHRRNYRQTLFIASLSVVLLISSELSLRVNNTQLFMCAFYGILTTSILGIVFSDIENDIAVENLNKAHTWIRAALNTYKIDGEQSTLHFLSNGGESLPRWILRLGIISSTLSRLCLYTFAISLMLMGLSINIL